jgi:hypothetical protein
MKANLLSEAQFYLGAIERRDGAKIAKRDMLLELVVIAMIGLEILLSVYGLWEAGREGVKQAAILERQVKTLESVETNAVAQGKSDEALMDKQNGLLSNLQAASAATAGAMKTLVETNNASVKTLQNMQATTEAMNKAAQGQLALFFDVALNVAWDEGEKRMLVVNNGRTNVTIARFSIQNLNTVGPNIVTPGGLYKITALPVENAMATVPKGSQTNIPMRLYLRNAREEEFILDQNISVLWEADKVVVKSQTMSIRPERWNTVAK